MNHFRLLAFTGIMKATEDIEIDKTPKAESTCSIFSLKQNFNE